MMKKSAVILVAVVGLGLAYLAGSWASRPRAADSGRHAAQAAVVYTCPMHPSYRSDHPGDCPLCGMRLVPVQAGGTTAAGNGMAAGGAMAAGDGMAAGGTMAAGDGMAAGGSTMAAGGGMAADPEGFVHVDTDRQQLIGVRIDEVKPASSPHLTLRVPGRVAVDDQRLYRVIAAVDGWIRTLGPNPAGAFVRKDEVLATYYTPNLINSAQTLVFAQLTNSQAQSGDATIGYQRGTTQLSLQVAIDSLRSLGMSEKQIADIERTRLAPTEVTLYSPSDGYVIARNISPEQRFDKGTELYRISDIRHVWVLAEVFEKDRDFLKPGIRASVLYQGRRYEARMSDSLPQFDPQTRTLKTRFELDNPGHVLWPDMFVDVEVEADMPVAVTVPADAIVDSGLRKTVFVERGQGYFEPRRVETGWRVGDRVQVTRGLMPGERIAISGTFLIDSESRMKTAAMAMAEPAVKDPVCGMDVDRKKAAAGGRTSTYAGQAYFFCSDDCKKKFDHEPAKYVAR